MVMLLKGGVEKGQFTGSDEYFGSSEVPVGHPGDGIRKEVSNAGLNYRNESGLEMFLQELVVLCNSDTERMGVTIQEEEDLKESGQNKQRKNQKLRNEMK